MCSRVQGAAFSPAAGRRSGQFYRRRYSDSRRLIREFRVLHLPGHTPGGIGLYTDSADNGEAPVLFSGDTLFAGGHGRTDLPGGSHNHLLQSIKECIFKLDDNTIIYPGHDYYGFTASTVKEEKQFNNRLGNGKTENEFVEIMANLDLALPKKIKESVPGNTRCGL